MSLFSRFFKQSIAAPRTASSRPAVQHVESLETRTMLSVSLNSSGDTVITPGPGDQVVYCSSSTGSDGNNGLSAAHPVKSLPRAMSLMSNHTGDQLLLKAGDAWNGYFIYWTLSGRSAQDPIVLGSYGSGSRPTIYTGSKTGFETGSTGAPEVDYLAIMGIRFDANSRDPALTGSPSHADATGIDILSKSADILVENCEVENYSVNMNFQSLCGPINGVTIRRCVDIDSWSTGGHSQGIYVNGVNNVLLQGNYFDHNGWSTRVSGATPTQYNHDAYFSSNNTNCQVIDNVFADAAAYGLQARSGGIV
ncbi:MAG TPA: right-handed parallel beta-helix repeat-containing protein, partial [Humisphaera sp.]|nr:right-handed parallel beta-helix repeat-containing protein [Humisphaera sp.]